MTEQTEQTEQANQTKQPEQVEKIPASLALVTISKMAISTVFTLLSATTIVYTMELYGVDTGLAGVAVGAFILGGTVCRLFVGRYTDLLGRRRMIVYSQIIFIGFMFLYLVPMSFPLFVVMRFLHGCTFSSQTNALNTVAASVLPKSRFAEGMGYFTMSTTIAAALGPAIGFAVSAAFGYQVMFFTCIGLSVVALIAALCVKIEEIKLSEQQIYDIKHHFSWRDFIYVAVIPFAMISFMFAMCTHSVAGFLQSYVLFEGMDVSIASVYFVLSTAVMLITRPIFGRIMDRKGPDALMIPGLISITAGILVLAFVKSPVGIILTAVLFSFGLANGNSVASALSLRSVPAEFLSVATATLFFLIDLGTGLAPMVMGVIQPALGYTGMFLSMIPMIGVIAVIYHFKKNAEAR